MSKRKLYNKNKLLASSQAGAGSLQLVVVGLIAALLVVLAVPIFAGFIDPEPRAPYVQN